MKPARHLSFTAAAVATTLATSLFSLAPAAAAGEDPSIATPSAIVGAPGTSIKPFDGAVISGNGSMDGITLRITAGLNSSVDELALTGHSGITATYNAVTGLFRLRGTATIAQYQAALRDVTYTQSSDSEGTRIFTVVAGKAIYLPDTGNLYEFVNHGSAISWDAARAAANGRSLGPFTGHLANLTSKVENDVALIEMDNHTWIGATDAAEEGRWEWADGPEAGLHFWQGTGNGTAVGGNYNNWQLNEPNDSQSNEDYAHMFAGGTGDWNDFPLDSGVSGYLVEYEVDDVGRVASQVRMLVGVDTDGDGVTDADEAAQATNATDPNSFLDSDGDGVPDSVEVFDRTDANDDKSFLDTDNDGLSDYLETRIGSNPLSADSDSDGVSDFDEYSDTTNPSAIITSPTPGQIIESGATATVVFSCADTGTAGLDTCVAKINGTSIASGAEINTATAGDFILVVTATDSAGNVTTSSVSFTVAAPQAAAPKAGPRELKGPYAATTGNQGSVARLYMAVFTRQPDAGGYAFWNDKALDGMTLLEITDYFVQSPEFAQTYSELDDAAFIDLLYRNVMDRQGESGGVRFWNQQLADGMSRARVTLLFSESPEFRVLTGSD